MRYNWLCKYLFPFIRLDVPRIFDSYVYGFLTSKISNKNFVIKVLKYTQSVKPKIVQLKKSQFVVFAIVFISVV